MRLQVMTTIIVLLLLTGSTAHSISHLSREKMSELTAAVPQV